MGHEKRMHRNFTFYRTVIFEFITRILNIFPVSLSDINIGTFFLGIGPLIIFTKERLERMILLKHTKIKSNRFENNDGL